MTKAQQLSYLHLKKTNKVKSIQDAILKVLKGNNSTLDDICKNLKLKKSSVSGRISELADKGFVKVERKIRNDYGNWISFYTITYEGERKRLNQKRELEKIQRYKKYLKNKGYTIYKINETKIN